MAGSSKLGEAAEAVLGERRGACVRGVAQVEVEHEKNLYDLIRISWDAIYMISYAIVQILKVVQFTPLGMIEIPTDLFVSQEYWQSEWDHSQPFFGEEKVNCNRSTRGMPWLGTWWNSFL